MCRRLTSQGFHYPIRPWKNSPVGLIKWDNRESVESFLLKDFSQVAKELYMMFVKNGILFVGVFSGPQSREECCNNGINLVLGSQPLVTFSF